MVAAVQQRFGRIDVLVNNAGMVNVGMEGGEIDAAFVHLDEASWDLDIALSLKTAFNVTRAVLPQMLERGWGRIVMVSSVTGPLVTNPGSAGYSAAKAGMDGLMRAVAIEAARGGVTVNSVAPGWIATGSQTPEEAVAGTEHADRQIGHARGDRGRGRVPRVGGCELPHRAVDRRRRRQHDPGVQGSARRTTTDRARTTAGSRDQSSSFWIAGSMPRRNVG